MRKVWIGAGALAFVAAIAVLWPQLMAKSYQTPLSGWYPREDPGVVLVIRQAGHQEEMAFGQTSKAGVWLKAQTQSNLYNYVSVKIGDSNGTIEVVPELSVHKRELEVTHALPYGRNFLDSAADPGEQLRIAMFANFTLSYEEPRAAGGKASRLLQRTLYDPIEISHARPMRFEPAVIKDLGFAVRARAEETELRIMLGAAGNLRPRFAECWLHYVHEDTHGATVETHIAFTPGDGGLVASIPMSQIGSWMGHTLNTLIEVDVTNQGSVVTVRLKKP